jgi:hypothetical protein
MIRIGKHQRQELSDEYSEQELNTARVRWISNLNQRLTSISRFAWTGSKVLLKPHYKVEPLSLRLAPAHVLANDGDQDLTQYAVGEDERRIFQDLAEEEFGYKTLVKRLGAVGKQDISAQLVTRLMEAGLLTGYDANGEKVFIQGRLHFGGVGVEYEV